MRGFQKANLILVLLVAQVVQVLLLSVAVFVFFIVFGAVAMKEGVVESWIGAEPHPLGISTLTRGAGPGRRSSWPRSPGSTSPSTR